MTLSSPIPHFNLFGETTVFPDVVHCERVIDRAGLHDWVISAHRHSQLFQVFHIEQGKARRSLDGKMADFLPGEYLFVPPQVVHGFEFLRGTEGVVLSFPAPVVAFLGPQTPALTAWLSAPQQARVSDEAAYLIGRLAQIYGSSGMFRAQRLVPFAHALLATLAEESLADAAKPEDRGQHLQRLDALVAEHVTDGWSAADYASALHLTTGHLNRIVRGATGQSLTRYLETAVMTEACRMIAFTRLPLAEIAYRLGFADPSYFSRRFRAAMGQTPSAYRESILAGGRGEGPNAD